jgi:uncharacterized protein
VKKGGEPLYPCTIVPTRYTGAYEGGTWAAFELLPEQLDALDWDGDDVPAREWWDQYRGRVGIGNSPQEAYESLRATPPHERLRSLEAARSTGDAQAVPVPARVSFVTLATRDFDRMIRFYRQFGWPESAQSDDSFVAFQCAGAVLGLFPVSNYEKQLGPAPAPGAFKGFELAINLEDAARVDAAYATLRTFEGIRLRGEPKDQSFGGRSFSFLDPEDNAWEVIWAAGTSFDQRGGLIFP